MSERRDGSFEAEANEGKKHAFEMAKDGKARWLKEPSSAAAHELNAGQDGRCVEKCAGEAGGLPRPTVRKNSSGAACRVPRAAVTEDGHQAPFCGFELQPCAKRIFISDFGLSNGVHAARAVIAPLAELGLEHEGMRPRDLAHRKRIGISVEM